MDLSDLQRRVSEELKQRGFNLVRFARPPLGPAGDQFSQWIEKGFQGEMSYLQRGALKRRDPSQVLPHFRSVIVLAHSYDSGLDNTHDTQLGHVSRYAWGEDYHRVLQEKLESFGQWFQKQGEGIQFYLSVDAQPVLEKGWAQKAGLGWMGKHTNIINEQKGSYFFISAILNNLPFTPDPKEEDRCGTCEQCMDVCPTGAIVAPYVLDARLCISYLTIELKGPIPRHLRGSIGNRIFGCDDCQEVCPWNRFSQVSEEKRFFPKDSVRNHPLDQWLQIDPETFRKKFRDSAISRAKWRGFIRNVLVAMGNSGKESWSPLVRDKLKDSEPLVRGHAVWAYGRLRGKGARPHLRELRKIEEDPFVLEEIAAALS